MTQARHVPFAIRLGLPDTAARDVARTADIRGVSVEELCIEAVLRLVKHNHRQNPETHRDQSLTAKLTEREMEAVKRIAMQRGITPAEWCRDAVLAAADPERRALVAEVASVRAFLVGIIAHVKAGQEFTLAHLLEFSKGCDRLADGRAAAQVSELNRCSFPGCKLHPGGTGEGPMTEPSDGTNER